MMFFNPLFLQVVNPTASTDIKASKIYNSTYLFSDIIKVYSDKAQPQDGKSLIEGSPLMDFIKQILPDSLGQNTGLADKQGITTTGIPPVSLTKDQLNEFISNLLSGKTPGETNLVIGSTEGKVIYLDNKDNKESVSGEDLENNPEAVLEYLESGNFLLLETPGQTEQQGLMVSINTNISANNTDLSSAGTTLSVDNKSYKLNFSLLDNSVTKSIESVLSGQNNPAIHIVDASGTKFYYGNNFNTPGANYIQSGSQPVPQESLINENLSNTGTPIDVKATPEILNAESVIPETAGKSAETEISSVKNTNPANSGAANPEILSASNIVSTPKKAIDSELSSLNNVVNASDKVESVEIKPVKNNVPEKANKDNIIKDNSSGMKFSSQTKVKISASTSVKKPVETDAGITAKATKPAKTDITQAENDKHTVTVKESASTNQAAKADEKVIYNFQRQKAVVNEIKKSGLNVSAKAKLDEEPLTAKMKNILKQAGNTIQTSETSGSENTEKHYARKIANKATLSSEAPVTKISQFAKAFSSKGIAVEIDSDSQNKISSKDNIKPFISEPVTIKEDNEDTVSSGSSSKSSVLTNDRIISGPAGEMHKLKIKANHIEVDAKPETEKVEESLKSIASNSIDHEKASERSIKAKFSQVEAGDKTALQEEVKFTKIVSSLDSEKLNRISQAGAENTQSSEAPSTLKTEPGNEKINSGTGSLKQSGGKNEDLSSGTENEQDLPNPDESSNNKSAGVHTSKESVSFNDFQEINKLQDTAQPQNIRVVKAIEVIKELTKFIKQNGNDSMVLQLEPENLGMLKIAVESVDNILKANIEVESEAARQVVESNLSNLFSSLSQSGVQLNSVNISLMNYEQKNAKNFMPRKKSGNEFKELVDDNNIPGEKNLGYNTYEYLV